MDFLFLDDRVAVCVKPAGVLSTDEPGGMPELIREALGESNGNVRGVHRLDRVVGGVMVYARTRRAAGDLSEQIRSGRFRKSYLAVVKGVPEKPKGELRDWLFRDVRTHRTLLTKPDEPGAKEAALSYEVLSSDGETALLSVALHTGRTHQIRSQLAAHGSPILGDVKYGGTEAEGVALWSHRLSFFHPRTGEQLSFSAKPPSAGVWMRYIKYVD